MKNNIIYLPPFLIHEGFQQAVDFTHHYVLVKEDGMRHIYSYTVILDGIPHVDEKPTLVQSFTDHQLSDFDLKRNFVLEFAYHRGDSQDFIWSSVVSREEFLTLVEKRLFEQYVVQTYNELFPGRLVQELLDNNVDVTASKYEINKWWAECPLPTKSSKHKHGSWIDAQNNLWECRLCKIQADNIAPWRDNNRLKSKK
jgi:hypothetical protein